MNKLLNKIKEIYLSNFEKYFYFGRGVHIVKKFFFYKRFNTKKKTENIVKDKANLRVGFITTWNTKCGIAVIPSKYLVKELINRGIKVIVLSESEKPNLIIEKDENFVKRCWNRNKFDYNPIIEEIKKNKINIVHIEFDAMIFNEEYMFLRFLDKLDKMKIRTILSIHVVGTYIDKYFDKISDVVVIHNPKIKRFIKNYKKLGNKIHYVNLGVPLIKDEDKRTARKHLKIKSKHVIASSGFMSNYKNFMTILEAIKIVKKKIPDILYILASSKHPYFPVTETSNLYKSFNETIKYYKLKKNFLMIKKFLSEEDKFRVLHAGDILISYNDTLYLSQSGAAKALIASNRPVITRNNMFYTDMNKGVIKIKEKYPEILAETIIELFRDKEKYQKICAEGKQYIEENNFEKITDKLIKLYIA